MRGKEKWVLFVGFVEKYDLKLILFLASWYNVQQMKSIVKGAFKFQNLFTTAFLNCNLIIFFLEN